MGYVGRQAWMDTRWGWHWEAGPVLSVCDHIPAGGIYLTSAANVNRLLTCGDG